MPTSFTNRKIRVPITVPNGGTGRKSLPDKAVLVGAGTGNVNAVAPGISGNALISDGINWVSKEGGIVPADESVNYAKLAGDLIDSGINSSVNIDWSGNSIFTKILQEDTILTFSNYQLNKIITLIIEGNCALGFPYTVKTITGAYDGLKKNYITLHCTKAIAPQEVLAVINQEP
jgi:hypothetical protein